MGRPTRYEAFIIGVHELPDELPPKFTQQTGLVVVHDRTTNKWIGMTAEEFNDDYVWA